jgi:hypothetical protein
VKRVNGVLVVEDEEIAAIQAAGITGAQGPQGDPGPAGADGASWQFPVGWVLTSMVDINPATFLGYGTWMLPGIRVARRPSP